MAGGGQGREEVTRRMTHGYNNEGYQMAQSDGTCFKRNEDTGGGKEGK